MLSLKEPSISNDNGSNGSLPTIQSNRNDISSGDFAKQPGEVKTGNLLKFFSFDLSVGINPVVGLNPYIFANAAGPLQEPIISVPSAKGINPAATAAPAPPLDPAADLLTS